ncbi:hypothetical protein TRVA0_009S03026 [Trichomonascus vanleenenianus]|uniref:putative ATP-dependent permease ADP1 n=1 Tax=Trichomonascus vanleenenianus TaxID=2268995 RepID=UPI003EC9A451
MAVDGVVRAAILLLVTCGFCLAGGLTSRPDECPPCFNCLLPAFECKQFAGCNEFNGRCNCPDGFGGDDCSEPVCGALTDGVNRPLRNGTHCDCSDGWSGINCNMCIEDSSCDALMPGNEKGTCYTGGILVNKNNQMCNVTNRKILDILKGQIPQVTFSCNRTAGDCNFQFWVDERESFYCGLHDCEFEVDSQSNTNVTKYQCPSIDCKCIPGRMLCGEAGSIDISDFLTETIRGPGYFECDSKSKNCKFSEPSMNDLIKNVFGDPHITLDCLSSECLHYTELPGYREPKNDLNKRFVLATSIIAIAILIVGVSSLQYFIQHHEDKKLGYVAIPVDSDQAKLMASHKPATLQFEDILYADNGKQILEGAYGKVEPGQVMAIMGGSGAGKTTLLDILARKTKRGRTEGEVYVNGRTYSKSQYRRVIGFVDQEDLLLPTLTVYETIVTSALLRLPKSMSDDAKKLRALETMQELGIMDIKDQMIGNETNRGISGGEKRRVAIACELVTSPSILFLDEPTSGLDSYNAYNVVECLVQLAQNYNRTVVFTIHQPRSNIVALFDQLVLLAQGKLIYSGAQSQATQYFGSIGYDCPSGYNVADYLVDLSMRAAFTTEHEERAQRFDDEEDNTTEDSEDLHSAIPRYGSQEVDTTREWRHLASHQDRRRVRRSDAIATGHAPITLQRLADIFRASVVFDQLKNDIESAKQAASEQSSVTGESSDAAAGQGSFDGDELSGYEKIGVFKQFTILSGRTFKNLYRNPMLLLTHYVIAVLLAIFCGILYFDLTNDISGFQNRLGLFFFLLALFGFSTLTTLYVFAEERVVFVRERANGYYKPISYYTAKVLFDILPLRVLPPIVLGIVIYPLAGLSMDNGAFWKFMLVLVLFNLTAAATCLVIGILIQDTGVASLVGVLVMLFSLLFAGLFLNPDSMPKGAEVFQYLSIFHYAYEALAVNEVRYLTLTEKKFGLSIEVPGATILSTFGFDPGALWDDIIGLTVFFLVFLIGGYIAMHFVLVERR